jgi:hypothetical protein
MVFLSYYMIACRDLKEYPSHRLFYQGSEGTALGHQETRAIGSYIRDPKAQPSDNVLFDGFAGGQLVKSLWATS